MLSFPKKCQSVFVFETNLRGKPLSGIIIAGLISLLLITSAFADDTGGDPPDRFSCYVDADADGFGDPGSMVDCPTAACDCQPNLVSNDLDCDDSDPLVNPGAPEICDNLDNDCNTIIDDGLTFNDYYADADADGYGDPGNMVNACSPPAGYVIDGSDCDDADYQINPGATDVPCDGIDQNCDGSDEGGIDNDGDTYTDCTGDCNDNDATIYPGATEVACDDVDQDCDGLGDDDWNNDGDPVSFCGGDCDDNDPNNYPGNVEVCDNADNDCNSLIDDGLAINTYYADIDGDNYGDPGSTVNACSPPAGFVADGTDCNDADPSINPGAVDIPGDSIDQDCDGSDAAPCCDNPGDVNNDELVNILDIVHLINFKYKDGPGPTCGAK